MIPIEIIGLIEDEEEHEDRNCGCPSDYHMSDCPIRAVVMDEYADYEESWDEID